MDIIQELAVTIFLVFLPLCIASLILDAYQKRFGSIKLFFTATLLSAAVIVIIQIIKICQY